MRSQRKRSSYDRDSTETTLLRFGSAAAAISIEGAL